MPRDASLNLGTAQIAAGDVTGGLKSLTTAFQDDALATDVRYNAGWAALEAGDFDNAIRAYQEVLRDRPTDADAKRNLEIALRRKQEQQQQQQPQSGGGQNPEPQPQQPDDEGQDGDQPPPQADEKRAKTMKEICWAAYHEPPPGLEPGLEAVHYYDPPNFTFPFGIYLAIVDVDKHTGETAVRRFYALDERDTHQPDDHRGPDSRRLDRGVCGRDGPADAV